MNMKPDDAFAQSMNAKLNALRYAKQRKTLVGVNRPCLQETPKFQSGWVCFNATDEIA
jgi:hypothetical protein